MLDSWVRKIPWRRDRLPTPVFLGFPGGSHGKESTCNVGDLDLIPRLERFSGGGHGNPLQYSCLENPHGQRSLAAYSPWVWKQLDMTERLSTAQHRKKEQMKERRSTERKDKCSSNCWRRKLGWGGGGISVLGALKEKQG